MVILEKISLKTDVLCQDTLPPVLLMCPVLSTSVYLDGQGWGENGQLVHKHKPSPGHLMSDVLIR